MRRIVPAWIIQCGQTHLKRGIIFIGVICKVFFQRAYTVKSVTVHIQNVPRHQSRSSPVAIFEWMYCDKLIMHDSRNNERMVVCGINVFNKLIKKLRNIRIFRRDIFRQSAFRIINSKQHTGRHFASEPDFFLRRTFFHHCLHLKKQFFRKRCFCFKLFFKQIQSQKVISNFLLGFEKMLVNISFHRFVRLCLGKRVALYFIGSIRAFLFWIFTKSVFCNLRQIYRFQRKSALLNGRNPF